jgi:hypothetical protein
MASNFECLGLAVSGPEEYEAVVGRALANATPVGRVGDALVVRWQDPSGVRLIASIQDGSVTDLLPSYASEPGAQFADVRMVNDEVATAAVVDEAGEQSTQMAVELEDRAVIRAAGGAHPGGRASVVALGVDVGVHADEHAFADSPASLLGAADEAGDPPAHFVERGWSWPPRMAAQSFISHGVFGDPDDAQAFARLAGIVPYAERRTVSLTGQAFIVARVRTVGFEADLCLPGSDHPQTPTAGQVVAGTVFLVAALGLALPDGYGAKRPQGRFLRRRNAN